MIVADSNVIAYLLIPGDKSAMADEIFLKDPDWAVPLICRSEIRNILTLYMRHEKMSLHQAQATMEKAERLWREHEYSVPSHDVLALTHKHKVTAYDGEFVVLAQELNVTLVTFDKAVTKLFPGIAIDPADYLKQ
jgi:predicted nucleic acid-binding protein